MKKLVQQRMSSLFRPATPLFHTPKRDVHVREHVIAEGDFPVAVVANNVHDQLPLLLQSTQEYIDLSWKTISQLTVQTFSLKPEKEVIIAGALQTAYIPVGKDTDGYTKVRTNTTHCLACICVLNRNGMLVPKENTIIDVTHPPKPVNVKDVVIPEQKIIVTQGDYQHDAVFNKDPMRIKKQLADCVPPKYSYGAKTVMLIALLDKTIHANREHILQERIKKLNKRKYDRQLSSCAHFMLEAYGPVSSIERPLAKGLLPIDALAQLSRLLFTDCNLADKMRDAMRPYQSDMPLQIYENYRQKQPQSQKNKSEQQESPSLGLGRS